jgi:hypothetical protein
MEWLYHSIGVGSGFKNTASHSVDRLFDRVACVSSDVAMAVLWMDRWFPLHYFLCIFIKHKSAKSRLF